MNWKDYVEHVYCICSDEENKDNIAELERVKLYNTDIFSFFYYTLDKPFTAYKYFRDAAVIEAICDANKKGYSSIMIIRDELQFLDSIDAIESEIKKCDKYIYNILNTGDISEDCVIIRKPIIDYIANINIEVTNYNYFNDEHNTTTSSEYFTCTNWQNIITDYIKANFNFHKVNIAQHKIDYVISYVDSSDVNWQEEFKKAKVTNKLINGSQRWRDWGFFEYNIQCLKTNLQWLNNIYIIVSGTSQIPEWASKYLNVKWVLHSDYIDTSYLPTFNSCAIESFLFNIPNLSEHFIYSNDDVFCINNIDKNDFFENGKLKFATTKLGNITTNHINICKNSFKLLLGEFSQSYFSEIKIDNYFKRLTHTPHPMLKSVGKHIYKLNKKAIDKSITKFRTDANINQYIFPLYNYLTNEYIEYEIPFKYLKLEDLTNLTNTVDNKKIICLNDNKQTYADETEIKNSVINFFATAGYTLDNNILSTNKKETIDLVSVIIPVYNAEQYLSQCIDSVINQTYKNLEIIIVNDGSTDNTASICKQYAKKDKRIIFIDKKNEGVSATRNIGLSKCTGKWVTFLDADDWYELNRIELCINVAKEHNVNMVQNHFSLISDTVSTWNWPTGIYDISTDKLLLSSPKYDIGHIANKLYNIEIIKKHKIEFDNCDMCEDLLFNIKYYTYSEKIEIIPDKLYNYRRNNNSSLSKSKLNPTRRLKLIKSVKNTIDILNGTKFDNIKERFTQFITNCIRKHSDNTLDIVIPYVDSNDKKWQEIYKQYNNNIEKEATSPIRFTGNDLFKYVFRGIEKNINFIGIVHLVVMSETQIPNWLNTDNINIVLHDEIIPKQYLPTFNSSVIELFIPNIIGLSKVYINSNDDMYPISKFTITDFIENNKPCVLCNQNKNNENNIGKIWYDTFNNSLELGIKNTKYNKLTYINNDVLTSIPHVICAIDTSIVKTVWKTYNKELINSISRFRENKNVSEYVYHYYTIFHDLAKHKFYEYSYEPSQANRNRVAGIILSKDKNKPKCICINTTNETEKNNEILDKAFLQLFPKKCKYEL